MTHSIMEQRYPLTMSSREIAEFCEKKHQHVRRDIRKMFGELSLDEKGYVQIWTDPRNGQEYEEYRLDKELTYTLIAGYNVKTRNAIIRRWMELERRADHGPSFQIPTSLPEALRLAAEQAERVAELEPKAAALEAISQSSDDIGVRDAGRELGIGQTRLAALLIERRWACREGSRSRLKPAHYGLSTGYVRLVTRCYTDHRTGEDRISDVLVVTRKGMTRLAELLASEKERV